MSPPKHKVCKILLVQNQCQASNLKYHFDYAMSISQNTQHLICLRLDQITSPHLQGYRVNLLLLLHARLSDLTVVTSLDTRDMSLLFTIFY
ncbi:hypothetical protein Hanom_Chr09g00781281 [Helianthus anomalus]